MRSVSAVEEKTTCPDRLSEGTPDKPNNPAPVSEFDFHEGLNQILADFWNARRGQRSTQAADVAQIG